MPFECMVFVFSGKYMVAPLIDNDKWLLFLMAEGKRSVSSLFLAQYQAFLHLF